MSNHIEAKPRGCYARCPVGIEYACLLGFTYRPGERGLLVNRSVIKTGNIQRVLHLGMPRSVLPTPATIQVGCILSTATHTLKTSPRSEISIIRLSYLLDNPFLSHILSQDSGASRADSEKARQAYLDVSLLFLGLLSLQCSSSLENCIVVSGSVGLQILNLRAYAAQGQATKDSLFTTQGYTPTHRRDKPLRTLFPQYP